MEPFDPVPAGPFDPVPPTVALPGVDGVTTLVAATVDSDADGVPDTAVVPGTGSHDPVLTLATDLDGDGDVDVVTAIAADGTAHTASFDGGDASAPAGWDPGWDAPAPPSPVLDPASGRWIHVS